MISNKPLFDKTVDIRSKESKGNKSQEICSTIYPVQNVIFRLTVERHELLRDRATRAIACENQPEMHKDCFIFESRAHIRKTIRIF